MVNHSNNPTVAENPNDGHDYTTQDVYEGEELTEDYRTYDYVPLNFLRNSVTNME